MKTRLISICVAASFALVFSLGAAAQFPKIKKPKEEKPAPPPAESTEAKPAASTTSSDTLKKVAWGDNGISFEVPDNWEQSSLDTDFASFHLPDSPDGVSASMNISRLGAGFPADQSLKAYRDSAAKEKSEGKLASWADQNIGAANGLNMLEAGPRATTSAASPGSAIRTAADGT